MSASVPNSRQPALALPCVPLAPPVLFRANYANKLHVLQPPTALAQPVERRRARLEWCVLAAVCICCNTAITAASAADIETIAAGDILAPQAFRAAAAKVRPSLVSIEAFADIAPGRAEGIHRLGEGPTSGLIVSPDGYIVTSTFNFIRQPKVITVVLADRSRHLAKLLGRDETRKICLLKIDGVKDLPVPTFALRDKLQVGQWAITLGVGYGDTQPALSAGIISALARVGGRAVQTDANISPANYGGPLLDIEGRVIGVCVPLSPHSKEEDAGVEWYDSGIGFAIPLAESEKLLLALRKEGHVIRAGVLGVQLKAAEDNQPGAIVGTVMPNLAAAKAGMKSGDRIVGFEGQSVSDVSELRIMLSRFSAGERVKLQVKRDNDTLTLELELSVAPPSRPAGPPR